MSDSASASGSKLQKPGGIRKAQAAERRRLLLEAALQLFSERGYRDAPVRELTRATGVTEAVLYHYFDNKAGILRAVLAEYAPFASTAATIEAQGDAPLEMVLRDAAAAMLVRLHERRNLVLTMLSEAPTEPELAGLLSSFLEQTIEAISALLANRQERGEVAADTEIRAMAHAFVGGLVARFLTQTLGASVSPTAEDHRAFAADFARALCSGARGRP